ncbi:NAD(P)H-hydrate dehydratase [Luteolibacter algae]|uniref:ADP-dependent (S)-NAD(P)H-hydrate dehydratase n=1 Tax=Luteolibacter algae TaxID=454151 RepID=A0ABW5D7K9_9BACT
MAAVTVSQMRKIESAAMARGLSEAELMTMAGEALGHAIANRFPHISCAIAYIGKGHNAGDALIALRVLAEEFGWQIGVRAAYPQDQWATLMQSQREGLGLDVPLEKPLKIQLGSGIVLIDGLLGIGARGALKEPLVEMAREMRTLRERCGVVVVSVDLPSGVDPDSGEVHADSVTADMTFMIGCAKRGLLASTAVNAVGALALVEVEGLSADEECDLDIICPQIMHFGKHPREFDFHKGKAGRVAIVAGSAEFSGAALITALGAIRGGGGLVTIYAREAACAALRSRLPLEVMLKSCDDPRLLLLEKMDAIVLGPGLGEMTSEYEDGILTLVRETPVPLLIDADGLNLLSRKNVKLDARHVLTPHPGEFKRLAPELEGLSREEAAHKFTAENEAILLLKGGRTIVAQNGSTMRVNSTGTPGMSNGGQGDLLAGVTGAFLAGGITGFDAASLGAWVCGYAAELAVNENGEISTATQTAEKIGAALAAWRRKLR